MFRKVLFPTDFSRHADKLLGCIPDLQRLGTKDVSFVHIINPMKAARWISVDKQIIEKAKHEALKSMEATVRKVTSRYGVDATYRIETGVIYQKIKQVADEEQVSLIVMGSHGHGFVKGAFLGSVTQNVLRTASVPLIIEKFTQTKKNGKEIFEYISDNMFSRLLFPTDFSDNSFRAFEALKLFKNAGVHKIYIVHVQDTGRLTYFSRKKIDVFNRKDSERLLHLKKKLELLGYNVETVLREDVPFREINRIAEEKDVSMIVLGSHGKSAVKDTLIGGVTESVVLGHVRPLMVIPKNWNIAER